MRFLGEKSALNALRELKNEYRAEIASYEKNAKSCMTCDTPGACCLDAHFVNVHITRLEAAAIKEVLSELPEDRRRAAYDRAEAAVETYSLMSDGDSYAKTFACPLFEKGAGCMVHHEAKPAPCIQHACYQRASDLPPDHLLIRKEAAIEDLNRRTYGKAAWRSLPLWLARCKD